MCHRRSVPVCFGGMKVAAVGHRRLEDLLGRDQLHSQERRPRALCRLDAVSDDEDCRVSRTQEACTGMTFSTLAPPKGKTSIAVRLTSDPVALCSAPARVVSPS